MKLGVASFVAALLAAPLAAQAADSPARFAVTLRATIADRFTYDYFQSDGDCRVTKNGSGGGELRLRSIRPARIRVVSGSRGLVYRPSRLAGRLRGRSGAGSFEEVRMCRGAPIERAHGDCRSEPLPARIHRLRLRRPHRGRLAFRRTPRPSEPVRLCGLGRRPLLRAWLDLAQGAVDEDDLLNGRSARVIVRGRALREGRVFEQGGLTIKQRATVSWTLTFRRLG